MKRWLPFAFIVVVAVAALIVNQRMKSDGEANPRSLLYNIATTGREITRAPAQLTRISDEDEVRIGDAMASQYPHALTAGDQQVEQYISRLGDRIGTQARRRLPYRFQIG